MIKIKELSKNFGNKNVLSNISIDINQFDRLAIMGKSGRGKTTLINIIIGTIKKYKGNVINTFNGTAVVFQENRLLDNFTAFDNVKLITDANSNIILSHFNELGLAGEEYILAGKYSGGMKRRLSIIRAVLADAELIIMDEAFKGLDLETRYLAYDYVNKYTKEKTCVFITHDIEEANRLNCTRIITI